MAEVTTMVIKVDLDCEKCHKKIKKVLCQISQIQNQEYDKKANTVTITVVCCSPEKIKKKICCKGGKAIKGIEIKVPEKKNKAKEHENPEPKKEIVNKVPDKQEKDEESEKKQKALVQMFPARDCCRECYQGFGWVQMFPARACCRECYQGFGRAAPAPAPPCYGRPVYDSWGGGGCPCHRSGYYVCRCEFVSDDSQSTCGIM